MKRKQTIRLAGGVIGLFGLMVAMNTTVSPTAYADPPSASTECADGATKTATKEMRPDVTILDEKDFDHACRNNGGYEAPAATGAVLDDPVKGNDCGGVKTAIIKCNADNSGDINKNGVWALLLIAINIMTAGVGILAVGGIVYGAILYTTAEDKADQVKKAIDIITNVIIGLIAFALMWAGLNFLIPGGVFAA